MACSDKKRLSNAANSLKSTGPKSKEGKRKVALNSLRHGLRSPEVLLPGEDHAAFDAMIGAWMGDWQPPTDARRVLVEQCVAHAWRLRRCLKLERDHLVKRGRDAARRHERESAARVAAAVKLLGKQPDAVPEDPPLQRARGGRGPDRALGGAGRGGRLGRDVVGPDGAPPPAAQPARLRRRRRGRRDRRRGLGLVVPDRVERGPSRPPTPTDCPADQAAMRPTRWRPSCPSSSPVRSRSCAPTCSRTVRDARADRGPVGERGALGWTTRPRVEAAIPAVRGSARPRSSGPP